MRNQVVVNLGSFSPEVGCPLLKFFQYLLPTYGFGGQTSFGQHACNRLAVALPARALHARKLFVHGVGHVYQPAHDVYVYIYVYIAIWLRCLRRSNAICMLICLSILRLKAPLPSFAVSYCMDATS